MSDSQRLVLALDLGGTKLDGALVDPDGHVLEASRNRHPSGPDATHESLRSAVDRVVATALAQLPAGAELIGAGVGSAGPVDLAEGVVHPVNMPKARGLRIVDAVRDALRRAGWEPPVELGLDGPCLALAESRWGATHGTRASMSVVVSTGVGGGIVMDGKVVTGRSGNAGHIGQTHVALAGLPGGGADDDTRSIEPLASGPASVRWAREQGWTGETGEDLARSAAAGDRVARTAVERSAAVVGRAFADAATLLDLEVIAIGGGFSRVSADYVDLVAAALLEAASLDYARRARIVRSALDDRGPLLGAAALVLG